MNARDRWPVAIGAGLLVALIGGFQAVVQSSVDRGAARRADVARVAERGWRCRSLREPGARVDCLRNGDALAAAAP